ncbi:PepSY domain-containing protein [Arthrobacter sp. NA-172]|uniref:PepSY domain-containing protein n=1 Tax=Arthrobacter sp. NA-172 TaxID=3367524 RepID=UPI003754A320
MNKVRKIAAGVALVGAVAGGGALTAMALPANAATTDTSTASPSAPASGAPTHGNETDLTGDTATKVKAAVLAANSGATVDNMTTEGDGSAAYEAHITKSDGTHATVKLDASFKVTATETGGPGGGKGGHHGNETDLTGDTATKVKAAVLAANSGATVENMTTEDDGSAAYEAHITKSDGTHATVKLDANFKVTATETGGPGGGH